MPESSHENLEERPVILTGLDTRQKIVAVSDIRRDGRPLRMVIGYFDPLQASHIRLLESHDTPHQTVVAVEEYEGSLLPQRARAEVVAALQPVDFVVTDGSRAAISALSPERIEDERDADMKRRRELEQHIRLRHGLR